MKTYTNKIIFLTLEKIKIKDYKSNLATILNYSWKRYQI